MKGSCVSCGQGLIGKGSTLFPCPNCESEIGRCGDCVSSCPDSAIALVRAVWENRLMLEPEPSTMLGLLDSRVRVTTRGGDLHVQWAGEGHAVRMKGPAVTVYEGTIEI